MTATQTEQADQQGFALITVMLIMMIVTSLIAASLAYSLGSLAISKHDQDWNAALAAAQGGMDDYLFRLNQTANYWQWGAPGTCPLAPASCTPPDNNGAFLGFVPIPGAANAASYRYAVDATTIKSDHRLKVLVTGAVGKVTRTIRAIVAQNSFLNFLWMTNFETPDPATYTGTPFTAAIAGGANGVQGLCDLYSGRPGVAQTGVRDPRCTNLVWSTSADINGPVFSNDAFLVNGNPTFRDEVSTAWADPCTAAMPSPCTSQSPTYWIDDSGSSSPNWDGPAGKPVASVVLPLPLSNQNLKAQTDPVINGVGCLFTGPTSIILTSNGKMTVTSPDTLRSNCSGTPSWPTSSRVIMNLPPNGVVYVQNVPTAVGDPNTPTTQCAATRNPLGYPVSGDVTALITTAAYGCGSGDAFVSGVLAGQLTIGSENNIVIVGNLTYNTPGSIVSPRTVPPGVGAGSDVLGLVAQNNVLIYHPVNWDGQDAVPGSSPPTPCLVAPTPATPAGSVASSTMASVSGHLAASMIDGNSSTWFKSSAAPPVNAAVQVDLGSVVPITGVEVVMSPSGASGDYIENGTMEYSSNGTTWTSLGTSNSNDVTKTPAVGTTARYVRYRANAVNGDGAPVAVSEFIVNTQCPNVASGFGELPGGRTPPGAQAGDPAALDTNRTTIQAAMAAVQHSIAVENPYYGSSLGTLTINGALAQNFRGGVGLVGGAGYTKDYNYDPRLAFLTPPFFIQPSSNAWKIKVWAEVPPAFTAPAPPTTTTTTTTLPPSTTTTSTTIPTTTTTTATTTTTTTIPPTTTTTIPATTTTTTIPATTTTTIAPGGIINGGFEASPALTGWTISGSQAASSNPTTYHHSGTHALLLGSSAANYSAANSNASQTFTATAGSTHVSFWWNQVSIDSLPYDWATATLKDNTLNSTVTILAQVCTNTSVWAQVTGNVIAGHSYTLTLTNYDEGTPGDTTVTYFDDVALS